MGLHGMTMVIVIHEMGFARDTAKQMVVIDRGQVRRDRHPGPVFFVPASDRARQFLQRYATGNATAIAANSQDDAHDRTESAPRKYRS